MKASVLVPTKNGDKLWAEVLDAVLQQSAPWPFEVLVVDSGSTDDTVAATLSKGVRCEQIPPEQFGHGRTRNQLAAMAQGEFLVFITQDAKPAGASWLAELVAACESGPEVAASFGPHIAYPQARTITQLELSAHFAGFGASVNTVRLEDPARYATDVGYKQFLHFFSSNNACIRRTVWAQIPLPEVVFAEDQTWAKQAIEAGFAKAFAPHAAVYHSHDFGVVETLRRNFDESRCFATYFGYRLQPSLPGVFRNAAALSLRDAHWLRNHGLTGVRWLAESGYMCLIEAARMIGQYLGTHHQRLGAVLSAVVSRDESLKRKRA